jgi:hypothetical protein
MAKLNWSASESERVEPFRSSPLAFESTALRLKDSEDYLDDELVLIESEEEWRAAHPEINIQVDSELASRETGITEDELLIVLVLRDRTLNKFTVVNRWPLPQAPDMPVPLKEALSELSRSRLIDICTYLVPASSKERGDGVATDSGQVLARKVFKVRVYQQKSKFPKRWATPEEFEARGLPRDTVYWIDWIAFDLNKHPSETFEVWLNIEYKVQITSFDLGSKPGDLLKLNLAASILTELAAAVFSSDEEPNEPTGTMAIVADELHEVTGKSFDEMRTLFANDHGGYSRVRAWAHEKLGTNDALARLNFQRQPQ